MLEMIRFYLTPLRRNEEGASAVEYGLLVALIAAVIVAIVLVLGQRRVRGHQLRYQRRHLLIDRNSNVESGAAVNLLPRDSHPEEER